ncbi:MAG: alpha/beta hydrolase, partial [Gemmatimonadales bacterium]
FKDWGMFPPLASRAARAGFTSVSFNMSGSGVDDSGDFTLGDRFVRNTYSAERADLAAVVDALLAGRLGVPPPTCIGLIGHSRGGGIAILHTADDRRIAALVTWAAIGSVDRWSKPEKDAWRKLGYLNIQNARTGQIFPLETATLDDIAAHGDGSLHIPAAASRIEVPWLIVHGKEDESVPAAEAELLKESSGRKSTELMLVEGTGHTFGAVHPWKGAGEQIVRVFNATIGFLTQKLG